MSYLLKDWYEFIPSFPSSLSMSSSEGPSPPSLEISPSPFHSSIFSLSTLLSTDEEKNICYFIHNVLRDYYENKTEQEIRFHFSMYTTLNDEEKKILGNKIIKKFVEFLCIGTNNINRGAFRIYGIYTFKFIDHVQKFFKLESYDRMGKFASSHDRTIRRIHFGLDLHIPILGKFKHLIYGISQLNYELPRIKEEDEKLSDEFIMVDISEEDEKSSDEFIMVDIPETEPILHTYLKFEPNGILDIGDIIHHSIHYTLSILNSPTHGDHTEKTFPLFLEKTIKSCMGDAWNLTNADKKIICTYGLKYWLENFIKKHDDINCIDSLKNDVKYIDDIQTGNEIVIIPLIEENQEKLLNKKFHNEKCNTYYLYINILCNLPTEIDNLFLNQDDDQSVVDEDIKNFFIDKPILKEYFDSKFKNQDLIVGRVKSWLIGVYRQMEYMEQKKNAGSTKEDAFKDFINDFYENDQKIGRALDQNMLKFLDDFWEII